MVDFLGNGFDKKVYFHGNAIPADPCLGIP
jgi:hypothetical protein